MRSVDPAQKCDQARRNCGIHRVVPLICLAVAPIFARAAEPVPVRSVALIPASEPAEYTVTLQSSAQFLIPLVATATHLDGKAKTKTFSDLLKSKSLAHGAFLTAQVAEKLRAGGYRVAVLDNLTRPADDPDSIDYEKLVFEGDIALQVRIEAIGFHSGFGSAAYLPKVNVGAMSFTRQGKEFPYEGSVYFGVDAKPGKDWAIVSPESASYPTYEALSSSASAVDAIYREALSRIAERVVTQFKAASPLALALPAQTSAPPQ